MSYTTIEAVKRYLGISATTDDVLIAEMMTAAENYIDLETGRTFEATTDSTRYFDAVHDVDGATLFFDEDICAITTVTNGDAVVVSSSEYTTMPRNETPYFAIKILPSANKSWTYTTDSAGAISVVGKWAYSVTAPRAVVQAATRLTAYLYRQKDNATDADRPVFTGDGNVLMPVDLPRDVAAMIQRYYRRI